MPTVKAKTVRTVTHQVELSHADIVDMFLSGAGSPSDHAVFRITHRRGQIYSGQSLPQAIQPGEVICFEYEQRVEEDGDDA